jgi:hypothetical protein
VSKENEEKIDHLTDLVKNKILSLTTGKKSGNYNITIEIIINQGGIREAYLCNNSKEKAMF